MNKGYLVSLVRLFAVCLAALFLLFFTGCAMKDSMVAEEKRIILPAEAEAAGVYKSGPLTVSYVSAARRCTNNIRQC